MPVLFHTPASQNAEPNELSNKFNHFSLLSEVCERGSGEVAEVRVIRKDGLKQNGPRIGSSGLC